MRNDILEMQRERGKTMGEEFVWNEGKENILFYSPLRIYLKADEVKAD